MFNSYSEHLEFSKGLHNSFVNQFIYNNIKHSSSIKIELDSVVDGIIPPSWQSSRACPQPLGT